MLVLVINSGSSSLKYQVRDVEAGSVLAEGLVEKIGMGTGGEGDGQLEGPRDHAAALELVDAEIHAAGTHSDLLDESFCEHTAGFYVADLVLQ